MRHHRQRLCTRRRWLRDQSCSRLSRGERAMAKTSCTDYLERAREMAALADKKSGGEMKYWTSPKRGSSWLRTPLSKRLDRHRSPILPCRSIPERTRRAFPSTQSEPPPLVV